MLFAQKELVGQEAGAAATWHSDSDSPNPTVRQSDRPNNSSLKEERKQGDQAKGTAFSPGKQPPRPNNGSLQGEDAVHARH